jgi:cupin superfamily acireductone dioxygenase involved in methionine salvage
LEKIKEERGYQYEDEVETPGEGDLQQMYAEHLHENEEIRFILEGCGYYDIRDNNDEWIRIEVLGGDLIVVPSGCYHRFMLDHTVTKVNSISINDRFCFRMFAEWSAFSWKILNIQLTSVP